MVISAPSAISLKTWDFGFPSVGLAVVAEERSSSFAYLHYRATAIDTLAVDDAPAGSVAWNVNESLPLKPDAGAYVNAPVVAPIVTLPRLGPLTRENVIESPSASIACSEPLTDWFMSVDTDAPEATGMSFTGEIVTWTVATFESVMPSFALNVKLSLPFTFGCGM